MQCCLAAATEVEGHADNAAPALFGGLNSVLEVSGADPIALRWSWPDDLRLVVATPAVGLATAKARAALPDAMPRADAIFNLQRVLSLVHALQHREYDRIREGVRDRWHQPARASLVPLLGDVIELDDPDVLGAFLSGAGPSVAAIARVGRGAAGASGSWSRCMRAPALRQPSASWPCMKARRAPNRRQRCESSWRMQARPRAGERV